MNRKQYPDTRCSIARTLDVVGERWSLLIVRDALRGSATFSEFRDGLGVPSDVLTARLHALVDAGVFDRVEYRVPGERARHRYELTERGRSLRPVLAALAEWGDENRPTGHGAASVALDVEREVPVRVAFVDADGVVVPSERVRLVSGPGSRTRW